MQLKPVRKIKSGNRSIRGKYASIKTQTVHQFESTLERDFLTLLEFDDVVRTFVTQPLTINYSCSGKIRRYTPDVLVYYNESGKPPLLCEIKYSEELIAKADELQTKFNAAFEYSLIHGYQFKVITEKEIRTDYLINVKFLSSYHQGPMDDHCSYLIATELEKEEFITPQQLINRISTPRFETAKVLYTLWQLVARKIVNCNMHEKLTMTSKIWNKMQLEKL